MPTLGPENGNINIDGGETSFVDFGGNDTYTILPNLSADVTITDNQASTINLPEGIEIAAARFSANGVQFTVNGFTVTFIGNPASFSFVFGGTPINPAGGTPKTFEGTAAAFGTSIPAPGSPPNTATKTGPVTETGIGPGGSEPTLALKANSLSVNEGGTATFTIETTNVAAGSTVSYVIGGNAAGSATGEDITGDLTGTVIVGEDGKAIISVGIKNDAITEGPETLTLTAALDDLSATASTSINDSGNNQSPVVTGPSAISGDEDTTLTGLITAIDNDGDTLTYGIASQASNGTAAVGQSGAMTYNPTANFNGVDSFVVAIDDGKGGLVEEIVSVTVSPVNDAPIAISTLAISGPSNTTLSAVVGATDIDGDVLSYTVTATPEHGAVTVNEDGDISYAPNVDFIGVDSFEITVSDGNGGAVTQVADVTVLPGSATGTNGAFNIEFDYRFDTFGFFTPQVRQALEEAARIWEDLILDDFPEFSAGQTFTVRNPEKDVEEVITLNRSIDDLLIFVGSGVGFSALANAGADGFDVFGDINRLRISSDFRDLGPATDFEPYVGTIRFNRDPNWNFDLTEPAGNESDFITTALHEIGHILGIGASGAFDAFVVTDPNDGMKYFTGPNATTQNSGNPVLLEQDQAHVNEDFESEVLLDPFSVIGERVLPTAIDLAILADIGYQIEGFEKQGQPFELATNNGEIIFGRNLNDTIFGLDGDDQLIGERGNDRLFGGDGNDRLFGGDGNDALFGGKGGDQLSGNTGDDTLSADAGDDLLFGGDGNDALNGGEGSDQLSGNTGNDTLSGDAGDDLLFGGDGNDVLIGGEGTDVLFGEEGIDTFIVPLGSGQTRILDMVMANEFLIIDAAFGFSSLEEVFETVTRPFSNVSEFILSDNASVFIPDEASGGRVGVNNIRIEVLDMTIA